MLADACNRTASKCWHPALTEQELLQCVVDDLAAPPIVVDPARRCARVYPVIVVLRRAVQYPPAGLTYGIGRIGL